MLRKPLLESSSLWHLVLVTPLSSLEGPESLWHFTATPGIPCNPQGSAHSNQIPPKSRNHCPAEKPSTFLLSSLLCFLLTSLEFILISYLFVDSFHVCSLPFLFSPPFLFLSLSFLLPAYSLSLFSAFSCLFSSLVSFHESQKEEIISTEVLGELKSEVIQNLTSYLPSC